MCQNRKEDVTLIQTAFSKIKVKGKFGAQPMWKGRIDGRNSKDLEAAITCFQEISKLKPTGKLDPYGPAMSKLKQAVPASFRSTQSIHGTNSLNAGAKTTPQLVAKEVAATKASAPFPKREREALARAIAQAGKDLGVGLSRNKDGVTLEGRFVTQLQIDGRLEGSSSARSETLRKICRCVQSSGAWEVRSMKDLSFKSKRIIPDLRNLPDLTPEQNLELGITGNIPCPVSRKYFAAAAVKHAFAPFQSAKLPELLKDVFSVIKIVNPANAAVFQAMVTPRKSFRKLTTGEITLAQPVFNNSIDFGIVKIYRRKYWIFQPKNVAMAPDGNIYLPEPIWSEDFSAEGISAKGLFIHEMTHVWQKQQGMSVILRGAVQRRYEYVLDPAKAFTDYGLEQQGTIARDYFFLLNRINVPNHPNAQLSVYQALIPF